MSITRTLRPLFLGALFSFATISIAQAEVPTPTTPEPMSHTCVSSYEFRVDIDGRQEDWEREVTPTFRVQQLLDGEFRYDWTGPNDASFLMWCRVDKDNLYFAIVGRDNILLPPKSGDKGDRFELWFEVDDNRVSNRMVMMEIPLWPALDDGQTTVTYGAGRSGTVPGAAAAVAERRGGKGFFLEVSVPQHVIGSDIGFSPIRFTAVQRDVDRDGGAEHEVAMATSNLKTNQSNSLGELTFERFFDLAKHILAAEGLPQDYRVPMHIWADVTGDAHKEWIGAVEGKIYIAGTGIPNYSFSAISLTDVEDITPLTIEAQNLDDDEDLEIIYRYAIRRETPEGNGSIVQEFVAVIDPTPEGLETVVHREIGYTLNGTKQISSKMQIVPRAGSHIVRFFRATGNLKENEYIDLDLDASKQYDSILAPWGDITRSDNYRSGRHWKQKTKN